jgi:hypothetical protein
LSSDTASVFPAFAGCALLPVKAAVTFLAALFMFTVAGAMRVSSDELVRLCFADKSEK